MYSWGNIASGSGLLSMVVVVVVLLLFGLFDPFSFDDAFLMPQRLRFVLDTVEVSAGVRNASCGGTINQKQRIRTKTRITH